MRTNITIGILLILISIVSITTYSQSYYGLQQQEWLKKAEDSKPSIQTTIKQPIGLVSFSADETSFQGWKAKGIGTANELYRSSFKDIKTVSLDFGEHITGYFSLSIKAIQGTPDAPIRLKLTFGEVPSELNTPFDPYEGTLSRAWLQDEVVTITEMPSTVAIQRRLSFRYVKIELLASSPYFDFCIDKIECSALTSATKNADAILPNTDETIAAIDKVGLNTLKECMQTIYEDGTKRDQRLGVGNLFLVSLANNYSFKNHLLTKRGLYLIAALSNSEGFLPAYIFEKPFPHAQENSHILDYSLLFNSILLEYVKASGDLATAKDLWPVAKRQVDIALGYFNNDGMFNCDSAKDLWMFFDWKNGLDKQASMQGLFIYTLNNTYELAKMIDAASEVKHYPDLVQKFKKTSRKQLFDKVKGIVVSGSEKQVSLSSQVWMVLGGVLMKEEAKFILNKGATLEESVKPGSAYLFHFYVEALISCGMGKDARKALETYWGGMVKKGADTFWEVYDPSNDFISPYNFYPINSYCHAWSCTPVYFIRKYPSIFQN